MSRFLKFIVHTIVIITIICVVGLAVPQFFGIQTVIIKNDDQVTNLPLGSVTYAIPQAIGEVTSGTEILVNDEGKYYRYSLSSIDQQNHTATAYDKKSASGEQYAVQVRNYVPKIVITIGYLGYLLIATESIEGLIVIGLAVLFLVILYIIAELWKKDPEDDDDNIEFSIEDGAYVKSKRELKREEKARAKRMKEEDAELLAEEKKKKKNKKKNRNIIRTGGFVDEVYEDELYADEDGNPTVKLDMNNNPMRAASAASDAHETLRREVAAATQGQLQQMYQEMPPQMPMYQEAAPQPQMYQEVAPQPQMYQEMPPQLQPNMGGAYNPQGMEADAFFDDDEAITEKLTASVMSAPVMPAPAAEQTVSAQTINLEDTARRAGRRSARPNMTQNSMDAPRQRMARQRLSAAELAERARRDGEAPEVLKDSVTNVTMFDYSDIIGGEPKD